MPEQLNYYIAEAFEEAIFTAGIVRKHQEAIMQAEGFQALKFSYHRRWVIPFKVIRLLQCLKMALSVAKGCTVYFHFPFLAGIYGLLQLLLHWRGIKTVALVIDIDGLRDDDAVLLKKEMDQLGRFSWIVAHNDAMKSFILSQLPGAKITCMQLFDYQFTQAVSSKILSNKICFAGNLGKSAFVYDLNNLPQLIFNLYGSNYATPGTPAVNVNYKGTVAPADLPALLEGSFGLVWDGPSIETCNDYLRYNNPHKLSLYLAAGLPVIVWKQSAVAPFVAENKAGILVDSLSDLPEVINQLSEAEYQAMQAAAFGINKKVKSGFYFKTVLNEIAAS